VLLSEETKIHGKKSICPPYEPEKMFHSYGDGVVVELSTMYLVPFLL